MTTTTPEQYALAELNGWDPQELADNNARTARIHELMRKHSKAQLLRMAYASGLTGYNRPAEWTKQEIATSVADQEQRVAQS